MVEFVKLHCSMLRSTIWFQRPDRELFITALLMAVPHEITEPEPQIRVDSLELTGWSIPPGWYGFCATSGPGLIHTTGNVTEADGEAALIRLGSPEPASRSRRFDGRRLVRVDGGYIVLNYDKYRTKDTTTAERSARYRQRLALERSRCVDTPITPRHAVTTRGVTQVEVEEDLEEEISEGEREHERDQTPAGATAPAAPKGALKPKRTGRRQASEETPIPVDWAPTDTHVAFAAKHGLDLELEVVKFKGHFDGRKCLSWNGRFSTWLGNAVGFKRERPSNGSNGNPLHEKWGPGCGSGPQPNDPNNRYVPKQFGKE